MMRFKTFIETEDAQEQEQLDESILRTGALTTYATKARSAGNKSEQAFKAARSELQRPLSDDTLETRVERIDKALDKMLEGLLHQREQIGNGVAVDYAGHTFAQRQSRKSR
ncbi:hypothetical protein DRV84_04295 [Rhodosalinus sediminis]|uniref:Uncharacterized protein n=2 Tax=Rhodosalinus sediminis TaxID=1940533 RepID=A0A3D9BXL4_9RHOB|nr:hypothetical protein DRV84_04295 [Rhodosalinus sediminis]